MLTNITFCPHSFIWTHLYLVSDIVGSRSVELADVIHGLAGSVEAGVYQDVGGVLLGKREVGVLPWAGQYVPGSPH